MKTLADTFLTLTDWLNRLVGLLLGLLLMVMTVATFVQVLVRFVFTAAGMNLSAPWTEEIARYAMIWVIFLGMGLGFRYGALIALTFLSDSLGRVVGQGIKYFAYIISGIFVAILVKLGLDFVAFGAVERSPALSMPKVYVYWAMPVGAVLSIINILALFVETARNGGDIRLPGEVDAAGPDSKAD
ncbi:MULTISPECIES: TRAP transporter small permease [Nitratireductor]|nr:MULTISPECIES: TRAP transporter small permease [Nitratireductor]MBY6097973.1 TRAP transporter small permease [Nitratireductor aquimarinus]MDJ1464533.1 TRAP transporter small permease [Nitratireductor sp. GZWM139]